MRVHLGLVQVLVEVRRVVVLVRNPDPDELGYWGRKDLSSLGIIFWRIYCFSIAYIWLSMLSSVIVSVYNQIMPLQSLIKIRPLLPSAKPCIPKHDHPQYIVCFFFNFYIFAHFSTWHLRWRGNSSNKGFCCCLKYETHLRGNNSFPLWRYS